MVLRSFERREPTPEVSSSARRSMGTCTVPHLGGVPWVLVRSHRPFNIWFSTLGRSENVGLRREIFAEKDNESTSNSSFDGSIPVHAARANLSGRFVRRDIQPERSANPAPRTPSSSKTASDWLMSVAAFGNRPNPMVCSWASGWPLTPPKPSVPIVIHETRVS